MNDGCNIDVEDSCNFGWLEEKISNDLQLPRYLLLSLSGAGDET
jgi:hypothetical protein